MKKRTMPAKKEGEVLPQHSAAMESALFGRLLPFLAHMAVNRYEDGEPRKPGWVTLKTLGAIWVVQMKEPDTALSLTVTGQTIDDALALADLMLQSDEAPWEPDAFLRAGGGPKKRS